MSNEITTQNNAHEMLIALRNTVAPGLTDSEFQLFAEIVKTTGLNPVTKEVWAIKAGGRLQLMTGINGFLRIANSHPQYDGMEVSHEFDGKTLISCTVKVYRKDRRFPSVATAYMAEYKKSTPIWAQTPSVMLAKCAKSLALREAFIQELGGLYTQEEMPSNFSAQAAEILVPADDEELILSKKGEVMGVRKIEKAPAPIEVNVVETPDGPDYVFSKTKAKACYYDIGAIEEPKKTKVVTYLKECGSKELIPNLWKAPIELSKVAAYKVEHDEKQTESN